MSLGSSSRLRDLVVAYNGTLVKFRLNTLYIPPERVRVMVNSDIGDSYDVLMKHPKLGVIEQRGEQRLNIVVKPQGPAFPGPQRRKASWNDLTVFKRVSRMVSASLLAVGSEGK
eukprot:4830687-Amphidinium_carterae.5